MRGEIASAADFHAGLLQISCLIRNASADGVGIGFFADESQAEPVILTAGVVVEQDGGGGVDGNQNVHSAVVIEVAEGEATCGKLASTFEVLARCSEKLDSGHLLYQ